MSTHRRKGRSAPPSAPAAPLDTDALHSSIADMEALLASPGWQELLRVANAQFGTRIVCDRVTGFVMRAETNPEHAASFHASVAYVTGQREAALLLLGLPANIIKAARERLDAARPAASESTFGDGVEATVGHEA